jgi:DNA-binding PadR family transcriptional regulator
MSQQDLTRVTERIRAAILAFAQQSAPEFHAEDLRRFVRQRCGEIAPGSADRILRHLRSARIVNYELVSRKQSRYRWRPVTPIGRDAGLPVMQACLDGLDRF